MTNQEIKGGTRTATEARRERLEEALRANLRRRKEQLRGRAASEPPAGTQVSDEDT